MRSGPDNRKANGKQALFGVGAYKGGGTASGSQLKVQKPGSKTAGNGVTSGTGRAASGVFRNNRSGAGKSRAVRRDRD